MDVTPTLALRLIQDWTEQGVDNKSLLKIFAKKGRAADEKSKDFEKLHEIAEKWRSLALKEWSAADDLYRRAVDLVQSSPDRLIVEGEEKPNRLSGALELALSFRIYVLA